MKSKKSNAIAAYILAVITSTSPFANAAKTWTGATDSAWANTANWLESALPGTTETAIFDANAAGALSITLGADRSVRGLRVVDPAGNLTLSGNNLILTADGTGIDMSSATRDLTISSGVGTRSALHVFDVAAGRSLTTPVPSRVNGANNNTVGGLIQVNSSGSVKMGIAALNTINDAAGNPFVSYGQSQWAATDATGIVIAATNIPWTASTGTTFHARPVDVQATFAQGGNGGSQGIRFADTTTAHTVTINSGTTFTARGILVAPGCVGATINGAGFMRPNRSSTAGCIFSIFQHSTDGDLTISCNMGTASSSTPVSIAKAGSGKIIFNTNLGTNGRVFNYAGAMHFGNGGTLGAPNGTGELVNNGSLVFNRTADLTLNNPIQGTGSVTKEAANVLALNAVSTYTGSTTVKGGLISIAALNQLGATSSLTLDGGGIRTTAALDFSSIPTTIGASGGTIDTFGQSVTLANTIGNAGAGSLTKTGAGSLTLSADNTHTGGLIANQGSVFLTNTTGSATGSGPVAINAGTTLGGNGSASGTVTIASGAILAPGNSIGTITVGGLTLDAGANLHYEIGAGNDTTVVTASSGLVINGGAVTLFQENTTNPFAAVGTYNLIQYTGSIGGAGISSLSVANPQAGFNYAFGTSGGYVTLSITASGAIGDWNLDGSGAWATAGNWTGSIPDAQGAVARFNLTLTSDAVVSLNGSRTVGGVTFTSALNDYTIASGSGGSLILDDSTGAASIDVSSGTHTISSQVNAIDSVEVFVTNAADSLSMLDVISGVGGLTKAGAGALALSASNTFGGDVTLNGGVTTFASGGLGNGTNLAINNAGLTYATGNTDDITSKAVTLGAGVATINTNGNDVLFVNPILGDGALVKTGEGKLTLAGTNDFLGTLTISQGTVKLGNGAATGEVVAEIINNSVLQLDLLDNTPADVTVFNTISGTGSLQHLGNGTTVLNGANTFTGDTTIATGGTLKLSNALALQNSTLQYPETDGALSFGPITNATLGNLNGSKNLALNNGDEAPLPVALTIGGNNTSSSYSGVLSGAGSLTKTGTGVLTLSGVNTYAGATAVNNNGQMILDATAGITSSALTVSQNATFAVDGGSVAISGATTVTNAGTTAPKLIVNSGTAAFTGGIFATGNQNSAFLIALNGGTVSAGSVTLGRTNQNVSAEPTAGSATQGLYVNGADLTITGDLAATNLATPNSTVNVRMDAGSITVGGVTTIGLNNGGRWSVIDISGGEFESTNSATGVVLGSTFAGHAAFLVRNAGKATVQRIQMGQTIPGVDPAPATPVAGTHVVHVLNGGELCIGTGGIVDGSTANAASVKITNGNLSACGNWSTDVPVILTGGCIMQAEDATATAYDISLTGSVSGTGAVEKTGAGKVTIVDNQYSGNTTVTAGTLSLGGATLHDDSTVELAAGAVLELTHSGTDDVTALVINGVTKAPGVYNAANSSGAITGTGSIRVLELGYAAFVTASGLTVGVNDGKLADPDNDGVSNQLEYVLGGDPLTADQSILPIQTLGGGNLTLTFKRSDLSESDAVVTVQVSTDLQTWPTELAVGATSGASGAGVTVVEDSPNAELDTITVVIPVGTDGKKFARVHSTMAP
jgi:autotransporter-associated beta strand protein